MIFTVRGQKRNRYGIPAAPTVERCVCCGILWRIKAALINTAGLCGAAGFLPFLFGKVQGMDLFPIGLAVLCMNTPVCTLLSRDPDLEQSLRILPGQAGRFCRKYCLLIFAANGITAGIYLCCWQIIHGGEQHHSWDDSPFLFHTERRPFGRAGMENAHPQLENRKRSVAPSPKVSCPADHAGDGGAGFFQ